MALELPSELAAAASAGGCQSENAVQARIRLAFPNGMDTASGRIREARDASFHDLTSPAIEAVSRRVAAISGAYFLDCRVRAEMEVSAMSDVDGEAVATRGKGPVTMAGAGPRHSLGNDDGSQLPDEDVH